MKNKFDITICYNGTNEPESYCVSWGIGEKEFNCSSKLFGYLENMALSGVETSGRVIKIKYECPNFDDAKLRVMQEEAGRIKSEIEKLSKSKSQGI